MLLGEEHSLPVKCGVCQEGEKWKLNLFHSWLSVVITALLAYFVMWVAINEYI